MTDKKFNVPSGSRVQVEIPSKERPAPVVEDSDGQSVRFADHDEDLYVRRGKLKIVILDLATRLRSVPPTSWTGARLRLQSDTEAPERNDAFANEYVEIEFEVPRQVITPAGLRARLTPAQIAELNKRLLGSRTPGSLDALDPFSTTPANRSGRTLYNCMPLPHKAGSLHATIRLNDASDYRLHDGGDTYSLWEDASAQAGWKVRSQASGEGDELWNTNNVEQGVAHEGGELSPDEKTITRIAHRYHSFTGFGYERVWGAYHEFDTGDTATFKVTSEPTFDSEVVEPAFGKTTVRVYLVPRLIRHQYLHSGFSDDEVAHMDARLMVYPAIAGFGVGAALASSQEQFESRWRCFIDRSPYFGSIVPGLSVPQLVWPAFFDTLSGSPTVPPALILAGQLVAVIGSGSRLFYVWRRTETLLNFTQDFEAYFGGVEVATPCT